MSLRKEKFTRNLKEILASLTSVKHVGTFLEENSVGLALTLLSFHVVKALQ